MSVVQYAVASDTGRKRRRNEDNYVAAPPLFAVADGMGGAQGGEVASRLAASVVERSDSALAGPERVVAMIEEANRRIFEQAASDPAVSGMGTTMTVALVEGTTVLFGHVGDSRAYLVRGETLEQLTEDHSLVNELLKSGKLSPAEAHGHPQRSVIMRAVGTDAHVEVDAFRVEAEDGDVFLLCSDGLTDMVDDAAILEVVEKRRDDLDAVVRALVEAANRRGGDDNITAVAFRVAASAVDETLQMAAVEPLEETREQAAPDDPAADTVVIPPGQIPDELLEARREPRRRTEPASPGGRLRLALMVALFVVAVALLVWGLVR